VLTTTFVPTTFMPTTLVPTAFVHRGFVSTAFLSEILDLPGALRPTPLRNSDRHDGFEM
jgi:hypothetical protein